MSHFSGQNDLYDHIYKTGCKGTTKNMDEMQKFEKFKQRTNGVIYKYARVILENYNIDDEIKLVDNEWKLCKKKLDNGKYVYILNGKQYKSLKALNKVGYFAQLPIQFKNILDLIPYYGWSIAIVASDPTSEHIVLAMQSDLEEKRESTYWRLNSPETLYNMQDELNKEYIRVINKYYKTKEV